jgi:phage terminase large subunit-like protein
VTTTPPSPSRSFAWSLRDALIDSAATGTLPELLATLSPSEARTLLREPLACLRDDQLVPRVEDGEEEDWTIRLILGGRGAGKTRAGAEWVRALALGRAPETDAPVGRIALVGETLHDVRDVMVEGPSGLLGVHSRDERPTWIPTRRRLQWPNGAIAQIFSAEDPQSLRGPQFGAAWADELAKWRYADATWDMLQFGLRLGARPRELVTTTPRPIPLLKRLLADPKVSISRASTQANADNLAPSFLEAVVGRYSGTRLGRQELDGEIVEEREDALWTRDLLESTRVTKAPPLARIVVAVDPPASSGRRSDACGIVCVGRDEEGVAYVLDDISAGGLKPQQWAARAAALYHSRRADALVVEVNQGGEMVTAVLRQIDPTLPIVPVTAMRAKFLRAEPVSMLYTQGRVRHVGPLPDLEDEMCDFAAGGLTSGRSPDRLDALVWALTHLILDRRGGPRIRML